jgi:hypothetical protein
MFLALFPEERLWLYGPGRVVAAEYYSCRKAVIGSTRIARRAGT